MISEYAFANARVGAMRSYLLGADEFKAMSEAPSFSDAVAVLRETEYSRELSKLSSPTLLDIENMLSKSLIRDHEKIATSVKGAAKSFLEQYARKFEIASIKTLIIMKTSKLAPPEKEYPWILYRTMTASVVQRLLQMETLEELIEMLKFTEYYPALRKALSEHKEGEPAFSFIAALDSYVYGKLAGHMKLMQGRDREIVRRLVGTEIDAKNLLTILRLRGSDEDKAWASLIPYRYRLSESELRSIFSAKSMGEVASQAAQFKYGELIARGLKDYEKTESLSVLELEFKKHILRMNRKAFLGDRFNIGVPIAYLNLKENEVRNVVAILKAKEDGLSAEQISPLLLLAE